MIDHAIDTFNTKKKKRKKKLMIYQIHGLHNSQTFGPYMAIYGPYMASRWANRSDNFKIVKTCVEGSVMIIARLKSFISALKRTPILNYRRSP